MNFTGIFVVVVGRIIFDIFLSRVNHSNPKALSFLHKLPESWKGKWYITWTVSIVLLILVAMIQVYVGFNEIVGYFIAGCILSITEFAFKKPEKVQKPQKSKKQKNQNQQKKKRKK